MKIIIIYFLLMSGPSIIIAVKKRPPPLTETDINRFIHEGSSIITNSSGHTLKLSEDGKLGENANDFVWAGKYDNEAVSVKIFWNGRTMQNQLAIYQALGALDDEQIEEKGIPRVYYHGPFLPDCYAIAMTLFEDTLENRYLKEGQHISNLNILLIFKRLIEILKYFHSKNVVHNNIKPENIFFRGRDVFIGDFDVATLNDDQNDYGTKFFASMNYWADLPRTAMDDLESLLYTMWSVAGIPMGGPSGSHPEGKILARCMSDRVEDAYMREKYKNVKDMDFKHALECVSNEVISWRVKPLYDEMIGELNIAIQIIQAKTGQNGSYNISGSPRLTQSLSTGSSGSVRSRKSSFDGSDIFRPSSSNPFTGSRSCS